MKIVAIMQPTYLPWSGYFGLMHHVDLFIILNSVQFSRRSWQQRNKIKTMNGEQWLTVPVLSKGKRNQSISEVLIDRSRDYPRTHSRSLELNYKKAPHFDEHSIRIFEIINSGHELLSELNIEMINAIKDMLTIRTPIIQSSELVGVGEKANLLASLCARVGATEYISPPGSKTYLDKSEAFDKRNIAVRYFKFHHPQYSQLFGNFSPYMSVIDLLFNCGSDSLEIIASSCQISK
jgi:hypothetical protein